MSEKFPRRIFNKMEKMTFKNPMKFDDMKMKIPVQFGSFSGEINFPLRERSLPKPQVLQSIHRPTQKENLAIHPILKSIKNNFPPVKNNMKIKIVDSKNLATAIKHVRKIIPIQTVNNFEDILVCEVNKPKYLDLVYNYIKNKKCNVVLFINRNVKCNNFRNKLFLKNLSFYERKINSKNVFVPYNREFRLIYIAQVPHKPPLDIKFPFNDLEDFLGKKFDKKIINFHNKNEINLTPLEKRKILCMNGFMLGDFELFDSVIPFNIFWYGIFNMFYMID